MVEYITKEQAIECIEFYQINPQHFDFVSLIDDIKGETQADVIERSKIDKAIAEICKINPVNENGYKNCDDIKFEVLEILKRNIEGE